MLAMIYQDSQRILYMFIKTFLVHRIFSKKKKTIVNNPYEKHLLKHILNIN